MGEHTRNARNNGNAVTFEKEKKLNNQQNMTQIKISTVSYITTSAPLPQISIGFINCVWIFTRWGVHSFTYSKR